jgi:hypothetical protein
MELTRAAVEDTLSQLGGCKCFLGSSSQLTAPQTTVPSISAQRKSIVFSRVFKIGWLRAEDNQGKGVKAILGGQSKTLIRMRCKRKAQP